MFKDRPLPRWLLLLALSACMAAGCSSSSDVETPEPADSGDATAEAPEVLLEPFDPPPLAEIDEKAEWVDRPVLNGLELLRERQKEEGPPPISVADALRMRNDSEEANERIIAALGRLPSSDGDVNWNGGITRHVAADVRSTNPLMISSTTEFYVSGLTSYGLFSFDWNMEPFASSDTVRTWQSSADSMYDKVVLRDDCTWSDGTPITAHDVVFSFKTIMDPRVPIPAVRSGTDQLRWVEAYDDYTLVFFHKKAGPTNVWNVNFPVVPKHIYEKSLEEDPTLQDSAYHVKFENNPVVGGEYTIERRVRGQEIVLKRRESWYMQDGKQVREKPYFATVRFRIIEDHNTALLALKSGEVDDLELKPEQWVTQTNDADFYERNTKAKGLEWVYFYFGWNNKTPFFSDKRVRTAMSYAFDHEEMLEKLCYGLYEPCNGIFHSTAWMAPDNPAAPYQQNLDRAEELLDEAGWIDHDGDGIRDKEIGGRSVPFEFSILCSNQPLRVAICTLLKENLDQIGIICNVRPLEATVLQQLTMEHKFQAMFGGWGTGTDPDTAENLWKTGEGRNFVEYSNPEIDRLFAEGKVEFDKDKRAIIYSKIHEILYEDQPYTWLYFQSSFYAFNKELRGYNFSPRGPYTYSPGFGSIWRAAANR